MQTRRITTIEEAEKKVHVRESQIEEVMEEEETLMEELRKQQEDIVRQGLLGEAKPAWDAALREVVDIAFQFGSTLPEVTETIVEQLLEGAHLASEDHVAALLLVHPERHGHLYVAECTEKAETYSARLKENSEWSPCSRNAITVAAYSVLHNGESVQFCPEGGGAEGGEEWRMCPLKEKCGRTFGVLLSGGTIFKGEWLVAMSKVAGQMLEMVWRREQLETLIKVAQAWVQDHASEVARTPTIKFMGALERLRDSGHGLGSDGAGGTVKHEKSSKKGMKRSASRKDHAN